MQRYKIICSNQEGSFSVSEDELQKVIDTRKKNQPAVFKEGIVINWNMYAGVVPDYSKSRESAEEKIMKHKIERPSPFAKLFAAKLKMFKDNDMTKIDEEVAREERKLKVIKDN
jgi:hypothetical protein